MTTNTIESALYHRVDNNEANLAEKSAVVCLQHYEPIRDKDGRYLLRSDKTSVVHSIEEASQIIRRSLITSGAKMPSQQVITEAVELLKVVADENDGEHVYVRTANIEGFHWYDTGKEEAVIIGPASRAEFAPLPIGYSFDRPNGQVPADVNLTDSVKSDVLKLANHLPIDDDTAAVVAGWAICSLLGYQAPIILIEALQASGKSVATRRIVELLDRQVAPIRTTFKNVEDLALTAGATLSFGIDNLSGLNLETSDALCMLTTGGAVVRRTLYSDRGLTTMKFRRAIVANGIDLAGIRGDLASRSYTVQLQPIERREAESDLDARWQDEVSLIRGGLMHLACNVLMEMGDECVDYDDDIHSVHRIVDFAKVVNMVDDLIGTHGLDSVRRSKRESSSWVVDGDIVAQAILSLLDEQAPELPEGMPTRPVSGGLWEGTAGDLMDALMSHYRDDKNAPKTPKVMGARLRRIIPVLEEAGVLVTEVRVGTNRAKGFLMERTAPHAVG